MAQYDFERGNKKLSVLNHTIKKYKTKYPNAEVGIIQEYNRIHGSFNLVQVKFESDSFISFKLRDFHLESLVERPISSY